MIALDFTARSAETRSRSGDLLALFELSAEMEPGDDLCPDGGACPAWDGPGRSSALLESLRGGRPAAEGKSRRVPMTGRQLGRYRLIERLGRGSQAEVWKAVRIDPTIAQVALKVLHDDQARDPVRRERFRREAVLGMKLRAPALLPIDEFGEADGAMFLVMPMVEGESLGDVIARRAGRPAARRPDVRNGGWAALSDADYIRAVAGVVARIARALESAHARGVVHRDIKPANILLGPWRDGRAFLCDFGLGLDLGAGSPPRGEDGAGTPLYMAPEKLMGREVDEVRCDVYSLGVTLFEAATLASPFPVPRAIPQSCLAAYLAATIPPRPRSVRPEVPRALEAIILKAMDRDPRRRYRAVGLADDLEWFLHGATARGIPAPRFLRAARGRRSLLMVNGQ